MNDQRMIRRMKVSPIVYLKGIVTFIPGALKLACGRSFGTDSPRYCYSVWLRHLVRAHQAGGHSFRCVAELGPGDSLGIGIAALLSGADSYFALDAKAHANPVRNRETFRELIELFTLRAPIPGPDEFPEALPLLDSYAFPERILDEQLMSASLDPIRLEQIGRAIDGRSSDLVLEYVAPWWSADVVKEQSVDMIFSQAVLEHVDELESTYRALARWLRPGGLMSHSIDFRSHGLTRDWFGHWTVDDVSWKVIRGRRPYLINRVPASRHLELMTGNGFEILETERVIEEPPPIDQLARRFRTLSKEDLRTSGVFVHARRSVDAREGSL
jgi:SAM-dependent methyltransferase